MHTSSLYPLFQVADVAASSRFYEANFGFTQIFANDWYIQLRATGDHPFEIALIDQHHDSIPAPARGISKNVILSLYVEDVDAEHDRLVAAGLEILQPLRSEEFGQRHFILADPDGILVDVITPIAPPTA